MDDKNQTTNAVSADGQPAITDSAVEISCTRGLADWLVQQQMSLGFSSYQSGRLYLVGVDGEMRVSFHERFFARAMGLWSDTQRILLSTIFQIWRLENVLAPGEATDGFDRYYVPRLAHTTGDVDVHEIGVTSEGVIVFVNTLYSCLAVLSETHSFKPIWMPPFISKLAAEDRCHLNGLAMKDGQPAYVTAVSRSDIVNGWRDRHAEGGCLIDVITSEVITDNLSMPHSPRMVGDELWLLNSGTGYPRHRRPGDGRLRAESILPGLSARVRLPQRIRDCRPVPAAGRLVLGTGAGRRTGQTRCGTLVRRSDHRSPFRRHCPLDPARGCCDRAV